MFRLNQGIYGQRQGGHNQMVRVKIPYGKLEPDQLEMLADTKFEFGLDNSGRLPLTDEALTPDSSRFWPADAYQEGISPPSFDKQIVRDYLETLDWNKQAPGPKLPPEILAKTAAKYREALDRLTR